MSANVQGAGRSGLYECSVLHERRGPVDHRFVYRLFYLAVDLDELDVLDGRLRLLSVNRGNLVSLREADYLPGDEPVHNPARRDGGAEAVFSPAGATLKARVVAHCEARGVALGASPRVLLVTLPRIAGYAFNPVSFFFCLDSEGEPRCAIAEVTNTYREMKPYFLPARSDGAGRVVFEARQRKDFYVSPFSDVGLDFDFRLGLPGQRLAVRIDACEGEVRVLHATLTGERVPLTDGRLAWFLAKYPFLTLRVIVLIHWQALRLWLRRVPHFAKSAKASEQRDLLRPHATLTRHSSA